MRYEIRSAIRLLRHLRSPGCASHQQGLKGSRLGSGARRAKEGKTRARIPHAVLVVVIPGRAYSKIEERRPYLLAPPGRGSRIRKVDERADFVPELRLDGLALAIGHEQTGAGDVRVARVVAQ